MHLKQNSKPIELSSWTFQENSLKPNLILVLVTVRIFGSDFEAEL